MQYVKLSLDEGCPSPLDGEGHPLIINSRNNGHRPDHINVISDKHIASFETVENIKFN